MSAAVQVGRRWQPGPIERRDTSIGFYESINPIALSQAELKVQRALLKPIKPIVTQSIEEARTASRVTNGAAQ